jgi:FkbM family methyltransferase
VAIPLSGSCASIVAIEANPQSFQLLELNLHINQIDNCKAFNIAANDRTGPISFLMNRVNSGGSKRKPVVNDYLYSYDNPQEISIQGVILDDFLGDETFDVIMMDIEGSEYFALKGMQRLLASSKSLIVEFLPHHLRNVSGVGVDEFLSTLPFYQTLRVPSLNKKVNREGFSDLLNYMYENGIGDDGLIFEKV